MNSKIEQMLDDDEICVVKGSEKVSIIVYGSPKEIVVSSMGIKILPTIKYRFNYTILNEKPEPKRIIKARKKVEKKLTGDDRMKNILKRRNKSPVIK